MAKHDDWIPHVEAALVLLLTTWKEWLGDAAKQAAFGWDAAECAALIALIDAFLDALKAYQGDNSSGNLLTKNTALKAAVAAVRGFANTSIRFNDKMTEAEKLALGIRPRDTTPTPHPVPGVTPEIDAMPSGRRTHTVTAINPETKSRKRPGLVSGVAFAHKLRLADEPKAKAKEMPSVFQTATVRDFKWEDEDVGKVADYAVAYEKDGGGRGEWSAVESVTVA